MVEPESCKPDIPEPPVCDDGYIQTIAPVFNPETGEWEGLKCSQEEEACGRCSTQVTSTYVTWVDRDGGCDGDYYNERVEYPFDIGAPEGAESCYDSCQVGNTEEVETSDSGWYDDGVPYGFGPQYANPSPPNFQHEGSQDQLRDYAGNVVDVNSEVFCEPYTDQDSQTIPYFEDEIAEKDPNIKNGSNCDEAWAWVRYFDPDGITFIDGPKEYKPWLLSVYEPEFVEILGRTIHKKDKCLSDIPEVPVCADGWTMKVAPVFNPETGEWEGLVCSQDCRAEPIILYTIAGNFPCEYYGRTVRNGVATGETVYALPNWVKDEIANGGCDLLDRVGCDGVTPIEDAIWKRATSKYFSGVKITSCFVPEPCVGCDGEDVPQYNPLDYFR